MVSLISHNASNERERQELLVLNGPHLDVIVRNPLTLDSSTEELADRGLVSFSECEGLIDTGATSVLIDLGIAQSLGLRQTGLGSMFVVGGQQDSVMFAGLLEVPQLGYSEVIEMIALRRGRVSHEVLLGRAFLKDFLMTFDGPKGYMTLARPPSGYVSPFSDEDHHQI